MSRTEIPPSQTVSIYYIEGIKEGRKAFERSGLTIARDEVDNLSRTLRGFATSSPVGQMLRGELDFWRNQLKCASARRVGAG